MYYIIEPCEIDVLDNLILFYTYALKQGDKNMRRIDLTGQKFNRLTVIKYVGKSSWLCKCDCGNEAIVGGWELKSGNIKSCGCYNKEAASNTWM